MLGLLKMTLKRRLQTPSSNQAKESKLQKYKKIGDDMTKAVSINLKKIAVNPVHPGLDTKEFEEVRWK